MALTRIAFFVPYLQGGGAEKATVMLANSLPPERFKVDMVCQRIDQMDYAPAAHVRLVNLDAPRAFASLPKLMGYLRRERPQVLYSVMTHLNIIARVAVRFAHPRCRHVMSEHNNPYTMSKTEERGALIERLVPGAYRRADAVLCVSHGVAEAMKGFVSSERIVVLANPVELDVIREQAKAPLDSKWFTGDRAVILCPARLTNQKGQQFLVRAHAQVAARTGANLVLLGDGADRPMLEDLIRELNLQERAVILPFDRNPYRYMARSTVVALPSLWEGFGMVLIEAMACGTAVVSSDCDYGPREFIRDGVNGRLVPPSDPDQLADALVDLLCDDDSRHQMARNGVETAASYDLPNVGAAFEQLLSRVLAKR